MKTLIVFAIAGFHLSICNTVWAQSFKVLHYTETSGYDHQTRENSLQIFESLAASNNFSVDNDTDGSSFNSLALLQQYAVVVFSNTSGDNILDSVQQPNFEAYINAGGSFLGIHAASDTYRHSTANGSNTGKWDWYAELLGASVQQNPNHVSGTPLYSMSKIGTHASTQNIPNPWTKNEEYYYWENGYYNTDNIPVLEVEQTIGPNGQANSYDSIRPMSWYKTLPSGGKTFYTALGHSADNYVSDQDFILHLRDALLWLADKPNAIPLHNVPSLFVLKNPAGGMLKIRMESVNSGLARISIYNLSGKIMYESEHFVLNGFETVLDPGDIAQGMYFLRLQSGSENVIRKFIVAEK